MHYNENDYRIKYEGQLKNNVSDGYGIMYFKDGSITNGEFKEGNVSGFAIATDCTDNTYYIGQFKMANIMDMV